MVSLNPTLEPIMIEESKIAHEGKKSSSNVQFQANVQSHDSHPMQGPSSSSQGLIVTRFKFCSSSSISRQSPNPSKVRFK